MNPKYDLVIEDGDGEAHGYVVWWASEEQPFKVTRGKAALPTNNSQSAAKSGSNYSVRDQDSEYIIPMVNFQKGEGQKSMDGEDGSAEKYYRSRCIDVSREGEFRIHAATTDLEDSDVSGILCPYRNYMIASFDPTGPDGSGNYDQIRYSASNAAAYSEVDFAGTPPAGNVVDIVCDGQYAYAAIDGTDGIWRGYPTTSADQWTELSTSDSAHSMTSLAYCGGYLYGSKGNAYATSSIGAFDYASPRVWTAMLLNPSTSNSTVTTTNKLVPMGTYVYWLHGNAGHTRIFKAQEASTDVFQEICTFPSGYYARDLCEYAGYLYAIGYWLHGSRDKTTCFMISPDGDMTNLFDMERENIASRAVRCQAWQWYIYFLLDDGNLYRWDLKHGGYSHVFNVPSTASSSSFAWDVTEAMTAAMDYEGAGRVWTRTTAGSPTEQYVDGKWGSVCDAGEYIWYTLYAQDTDLTSATGSTHELKCNINAQKGSYNRYIFFCRDDTYDFYAHIIAYPSYHVSTTLPSGAMSTQIFPGGMYLYVDDGSGVGWGSKAKFALPSTTGYQTFRMCVKGNTAMLYYNGKLAHRLVATRGGVYKNQRTGLISYPGISGTLTLASSNNWVDQYRYSNYGSYGPGAEYSMVTTCDLKFLGSPWVAIKDKGIYKQDTPGDSYVQYLIDGVTRPFLETSWSSFNMGGVDKWFTRIDIDHDPLLGGSDQGIQVTWYIDSDEGSRGVDNTKDITAYSITADTEQYLGDTTSVVLYLGTGESDKVTVGDFLFNNNSGSSEVVEVTAIDYTNDILTVTRASKGTTACAHKSAAVWQWYDMNTTHSWEVSEFGRSIKVRVALISDGDTTPVIHGISVYFLPANSKRQFTFILDTSERAALKNGMGVWDESPQTAIAFLSEKSATSEIITIHTDYEEDVDCYIEEWGFLPAPRSKRTNSAFDGKVKLTLREVGRKETVV